MYFTRKYHPENMGEKNKDDIWVAKRFAPHNVALEPGQIILSGSFTAPIAVSAGDTIHADYGPLGGISCRFV